jgi:hypothetical protein
MQVSGRQTDEEGWLLHSCVASRTILADARDLSAGFTSRAVALKPYPRWHTAQLPSGLHCWQRAAVHGTHCDAGHAMQCSQAG